VELEGRVVEHEGVVELEGEVGELERGVVEGVDMIIVVL
jgi:hypothetical protein